MNLTLRIASALRLRYNAKFTYLVDVGFANKDINIYRKLAGDLKQKGFRVPDFYLTNDLKDVLFACNSEYLTSGLESLKKIPTHSVDFVWSHSVLEHVRKHEIDELLFELIRILKPGSFSSHNIDYQDHLNFSLNNLRFSEKIWESDFFVNSGFHQSYTNSFCTKNLLRQGLKFYIKVGKWQNCLCENRGSNFESILTMNLLIEHLRYC